MTAQDRLQVVRDCYGAYESGDRGILEQHLSDDFTFSAPPDVGIDRATYFERCWPNSKTIEAFEYKRLFEANDEVFVTYESTKSDGRDSATPRSLASTAPRSAGSRSTSAGTSPSREPFTRTPGPGHHLSSVAMTVPSDSFTGHVDGSLGDSEPRAARSYEADASALEAAPGLARITASAWLRTAEWTADSALRAGRRLTRAALTGESPVTLLNEARDEVLAGAQRFLGSADIERRLAGPNGQPRAHEREQTLLDRGTALLGRSSDLEQHSAEHPAYARILEQLSPDEARVLRLLATEGPQPAVDVRTWRPLDVGSVVVAPGLSMIAQHAGCRHPARVPAYLANLYRLGLIWFSRDTLPDLAPYQVLEAQPDVIDAVRETGRARIVRRSIHLTPFGGHFCRLSLPVGGAEIETLGASHKPTSR